MKKLLLLLLFLLIFLTTLLQAEVPTYGNVTRLYVATFNRAPDAEGLGYWVNRSNLQLEQIAESFFDQPETQEKYPLGTSDHDFIKAVYTNLFNRDPDSAGWSYWEQELLSKRVPKPVFILAVINGAQDTEEYGLDQTILQNKKEVGLYYVQSGLNDVIWAKEVMAEVTADPQSVEDAKAMIDDFKALAIRKNSPIIRSFVTEIGDVNLSNVLSPNRKCTLTLTGLIQSDVKVNVKTAQGIEEVPSVTVSVETQSITFTAPVNSVEGDLSITGTNLLTVHPYKIATEQTPYLAKIIPEVAKAGEHVALLGANLPMMPVQIVFEGQDDSFTQTITPSSSSNVSFTIPQSAGSGYIYLQMAQLQTNRLYLSVKREIDVKVVLEDGVDINASDISFVWGGKEYALDDNFMTTLPVENSHAQYVNAMAKVSEGERFILYSALVIPGTTQTTILNAESTAIAWTLKGLGATGVAKNDLLRSFYDKASSSTKVQALSQYIALLQKDDRNKWIDLSDATLEQKIGDALSDVLQNQQQARRASLFHGTLPEINPLVEITQTPENSNIYFENRKSDGRVWIVNDTRLFLSVKVESKEAGEEYTVSYKHPFLLEDMQFVKGIVSPKGWPILGIANEKELELEGIDSSVEVVLGVYGTTSDTQVSKVSDVLKARTIIDGILVPAFNSILAVLTDRTIPKNSSYSDIATGLNDIYGGNIIGQLLSSVSNKNTTGTIIIDTYFIAPLKRVVVGCVTNPTGDVCQSTAKGLLRLSGISSDAALKSLGLALAKKLKNEVIKDSILAQLGEAGLLARAAEFLWDHLGDISNGISIVESIYDMGNNPQKINADIEFALDIKELSPLCVAVSPELQNVTFALKGEGFASREGEVPFAFLKRGDEEVRSDNTVAFDEGRQMDAVFSSPEALITGGSVMDASLFVQYEEGLYMMYPEWIKIIDASDSIVYFDAIEPNSAYRGATVTLKGCGWVPLDDIKVHFSKQDSSEYVEAEVLTRTADTLTVKVPNSAKSGTVYVTAGNKETRKLLFDVNPFSLDDPIAEDTLIKGTWIALSGQALTQAEKIYFTDHTGHKIEGVISDNSEYSLRATIPEGLAYGPVRIYTENDEGIVTNEITMPLVPKGVDANPSSQGFTDTIQVTLTQEDHVDIYYRIDEGAEQLYAGTITLDKTEAKFEYFSIYTVARVTVDGIKYESNELEYMYTPCGYAEELIDNECIAPCPENEELIDGICVNIFEGQSCPMIYDASLDDSPDSYFLDIIIKIRDKDSDEEFEDYIRCSYYTSYQLKWETPYISFKKNGVEKLYYESGKIWRITPYVENKRNGLYKSYYESGNPELEISYVNDIKHGLKKWYYDNGHIKQIIPYVEGKQQGIIKQYYESGQLYKEKPFNVDGLYKSYYESGQLYSESTIVNGKVIGLAKTYYESGALYIIKPFVNGLVEGNYEFYSPTGVLCSCIIFENGLYVGHCKAEDYHACYNYPPDPVPEIPYLTF